MHQHRFYLPPADATGDQLQLDGREAHHAIHVLRLKRGDDIIVLDGAGNELSCRIETVSRDALSLRVTRRITVPVLPCAITLLVGVPKGKIIESIIQKSVELGARQIVPLLTERVVTRLDEKERDRKREQWQMVAVEAAKQCGAAWLPTVAAPVTIEQFLAQPPSFDLSLVGSLQPERRHPREVLQEFERKNDRRPRRVAVWIGPEGDFTLEELKAIQDAGARPITLGNLTLRVETAAIYCLSILNHELNS